MKQEIADKWVAAMRSGKYKQGLWGLKMPHKGDHRYCCLGVLCELAVEEGVIEAPKLRQNEKGYIYGTGSGSHSRSGLDLPLAVKEWAGMSTFHGLVSDEPYSSLMRLNDEGQEFDTIAEVIEHNVEVL